MAQEEDKSTDSVSVADDEPLGVDAGRHQAGAALHHDDARVAGLAGQRQRQVAHLQHQTLADFIGHQDGLAWSDDGGAAQVGRRCGLQSEAYVVSTQL